MDVTKQYLWHPNSRSTSSHVIFQRNATSEKSANCESCAMNVMNASCANNAHLHPFVHSKAAPGSVIVPAQ